MIFRPSEGSKNITETYRNYVLTTFTTNIEEYNTQLKGQMEEPGVIADGPYISMTDPFKTGKSLSELAAENIIDKGITNISKLYPNRSLYSHQEEAIRKAKDKNLVVTTGTGSGKTESFLIPILNQLMEEKAAGKLGPGVRALIIYPMNALVNDQIERIKSLLSSIKNDTDPKITFGKYTGETPKDAKDALKNCAVEYNNRSENEVFTREEIRNTPPNILITNYAMLEYLLLRPGDNAIFSDDNAKTWKFIVLDEAHSYTGSQGAEVSVLLRRVKAMLNRNDIRFILTSATLGDENSNDEIVSFASDLCSAEFDVNSIIRSETVPPAQLINYAETTISEKLYNDLAEIIRNIPDDDLESEKSAIGTVLDKYSVSYDKRVSISETLFNIFAKDSFYKDVRDALYKQVKTLTAIAMELGVTEDFFTDYIAVVSAAEKDGVKLFDARYHMFMRSIEGVYVTLRPTRKLFVNKMETYIDDNEESHRVYQISFCSKCSAVYIIAQEKDKKLLQLSKENLDYNPSVYLLDTELIDYDKNDSENDISPENYILCSKCGAIQREAAVGKFPCTCGAKYHNRIIKVNAKNGDVIHKCVCCNNRNTKRSMLRPFFVSDDASASIIASALYKELPGKVVKKVQPVADDIFGFGAVSSALSEIDISKQFLVFSDSRQSAASFAPYVESSYEEYLMKRMAYQVAEENKNDMKNGVSLSEFITWMSDKATNIEFFRKYGAEEDVWNNWKHKVDDADVKKKVYMYCLKEISSFGDRNSMQNKGLLRFEVDIPDNIFRPINMGQLQLTKAEVENLVKFLVQYTFMKDIALYNNNIVLSSANVAELRNIHVVSHKNYELKGYVDTDWINNPKINKYVSQLAKGDSGFATKLLNAIFAQLKKTILKTPNVNELKYQLLANKVKVYSVEKLYRCSKCRRVMCYNIKGQCISADGPKKMCAGKLEEYNFTEELKDDYYVNSIKTNDLRPLVAKEHTAQISKSLGRRYQRHFKDGNINLLSCSTTFEMGVDVGSLETVFMKNMPPTPANYAQRAGRAGRSKMASAYAITYCKNSSHDLNYYRNPISMIEGNIIPPSLDVANEKITLRHIMAAAWGFFWRANPNKFNEYKTIGEFMDANCMNAFKAYIDGKPADLKVYLNKIIPDEKMRALFDIEHFGWINRMFNADTYNPGYATLAIKKYNSIIAFFEDKIRENQDKMRQGHFDDELSKQISRYERSIKTIKKPDLIGFLSKNNMIPRYSFPTDTVSLEFANGSNNLDLSRELSMAISEYAPGSEVVANGKVYTSRYVRMLSGYAWPTAYYKICDKCQSMNRVLTDKEPISECSQCGNDLSDNNVSKQRYIVPKFGFIIDSDATRDCGREKQVRTYRRSVSYVGGNELNFSQYIINGNKVSVSFDKSSNLVMLNESGFYICEHCGYTELHKNTFAQSIDSKHKDADGFSCNSTKLSRVSLGYELDTDIIMLRFDDYSITESAEAWTILYSMLEGMSAALNIERNEIAGCLNWYKDTSHPNGAYAFILFDNSAGGSGYMRKLKEEKYLTTVLKKSAELLAGCKCGGEAKNTVCYGCLCNFYNQVHHDIMKRKYALDLWREFGFGIVKDINEFEGGEDTGKKKIDLKRETVNKVADTPAKSGAAEIVPEVGGRIGMAMRNKIFKEDQIRMDPFEIDAGNWEKFSTFSPQGFDDFIKIFEEKSIPLPNYRTIRFQNSRTGETLSNAVYLWSDKKVLLFNDVAPDELVIRIEGYTSLSVKDVKNNINLLKDALR